MKRRFTEENIRKANKHMEMCTTAWVIRQMQIEARMRYHHTPTRRTTLWTREQRTPARMWSLRNAQTVLVGVWKHSSRLGYRMWQFLINLTTFLSSSPAQFYSLVFTQETWKRMSTRNLPKHLYSWALQNGNGKGPMNRTAKCSHNERHAAILEQLVLPAATWVCLKNTYICKLAKLIYRGKKKIRS